MDFIDLMQLDSSSLVAALDLASVAASLGVPLTENNDRIRCPNPEHADQNPSCTLFTGEDGKQRFKCHSCGERGDVIDLVRLVEDLSYAEALEYCAGLADEGLPAPVAPPAAASPADLAEMLRGWVALADEDPHAIERMLADRLAPYPLAWLREQFGVAVNERGSVVIPHYPFGEAEPSGLKWRSRTDKGAVKGSRLTALYGEWRDRGFDTVVLCEGESDCWQLTWLLRDKRIDVLALPSGVAARPTEAWIDRLTNRNVILLFDADDAGRRGLRLWEKNLHVKARSVKVAVLPEGEDVCSSAPQTAVAAVEGSHDVGVITWHPLVQRDGMYLRIGKDDAPDIPISDFTLEVLKRIDIPGEMVSYSVRVSGLTGETVITDKDLNDPRALTKWANRIERTWDGTARDTQALFRKLKADGLFVPRLGGKRVAGWHDGAYVFPGVTIGTAQHAYVSPTIEATWEDRLNLAPGDVDPDVIADLVAMHSPDVITPLIGWMAAAPLRALCSTFPSIAIMGSAGSGKTTLVLEAMRTFGWMGKDDTPITISATTAHGVWGVVGSTNAIPVWFDEYRPGAREDGIRALDQAIRDGWNGASTLRGGIGDDKSALRELKTRAPIVISGESAFTEQSHAERMALLTLDRKFRSPDALARLKARSRDGFGRRYLEWLITQHRTDRLTAPPSVDDRPEQVVAVCRWGWELFRGFAREEFKIRGLPDFDASKIRAEHKQMEAAPPIIRALAALYGGRHDASGGFVVWPEGEDVFVRIENLPSYVARQTDIVLPGNAAACEKWLIERFPGSSREMAVGGSVLRLEKAVSAITGP